MATKNPIQKSVSGTAVQLIAANPNRQSFLLRVVSGVVYLGIDNTVTVGTGFPWGPADGPFTDDVPSTDAWWAIAQGSADVRVLEVTG